MVRKLYCIFIVLLLVPVLFSGCWDKVEIDQRGFVGVIAVDMAPLGGTDDTGGNDKDSFAGNQGDEKIKVTYLFANPVILAGGVAGGGGDKPAFTSLSSTAETIDKANRDVDSKISRRLFFGFTQVIVFSEDLLKNSIKVKEVLDYFRRDSEFSRSMRVLAADGEASKVADVKPKGEKLMSRYIRGIIENGVSSGMIADVTFNEFIVGVESPGSSIIPRISIGKEEVKIAGFDIVKDYSLEGNLTEDDSLYFNALTGNRRGGSDSININNMTVDFTIRNIERRIELIDENPGSIKVDINIKVEGSILSAESDRELFDSELIKRIETALDKKDNDNCSSVIYKIQKEYKADALKISDYLRKFHPSVWEKVKDRWDEIYPSIKITAQVNNKIRRIGTVK